MKNYDDESEIVKGLKESESWIGLIISSLIGIILALILTYFFIGEALLSMWVLPGTVVALTVKYAGRPIAVEKRLFSSALLYISMSVFVWFLVADSTILYFLPLTNAVVVILFSKRSLSKKQEQALWLEKQGKFQS